MAIRKVKIKNFKCFKGIFEIELNEGLNILVGNNESGKSTILEAIHIALTGFFCERNIRNELSQYLFNKDVVELYINSVNEGRPLPPPTICIEIFFLINQSMLNMREITIRKKIAVKELSLKLHLMKNIL